MIKTIQRPFIRSIGQAHIDSSRGKFDYQLPWYAGLSKLKDFCVLDLASPVHDPTNKAKIFDLSPYHNDGVITGAVWKQLPSGLWYLWFDGTDDIVNIADAATLNPVTDFTLMSWIRVDRTTGAGAYDGLICKRDSNLGTGYMIYTTNNTFTAEAYAAGNNLSITAPSTHALSAWYHVALSITAGTGVLYVNGVSVGTDTCNDINVNASPLRLSSYDNAAGGQPSEPFQGGLALTRLLSMPLSVTQLLTVYQQEKGLFGV